MCSLARLLVCVPCLPRRGATETRVLVSGCKTPDGCQPSRIPGRLVSNWEPACCLVGDAISGAVFAPFLLALAVARLPPALDGPVHSWLTLLWYSLSSLFCEWAQKCLKLELFMGKFSLSLSLFPLFFSPSLAIPWFGFLSHVSSLRLPSGHSGLVLTLNSAARASLFSPCLLVADTNVWATSLVGVAVRCVICEFYLFIFPPGYVPF